jgi:hypothetical protein
MSRSNAAFDYAPTSDASTTDGFDPNEAPTSPSWAEDKNPTRPLPTFRLEEEARRLDAAAAAASATSAATSARFDDDATVTVSAEENKKLLASVFAGAVAASNGGSLGDRPCNEEDPTLDAPSPSSPAGMAVAALPRPVRITARPPALKSLVITRPAPIHSPRLSDAPGAVVVANGATQPLEFPRAAPPLFMALVAPASAPSPAPFPAACSPAAVAPSGFRPRITPELAQAARDARDAREGGEIRRSAATFKIQLPKPNTTTYVVAGIWAMALSLIAVLMFMATSA